MTPIKIKLLSLLLLVSFGLTAQGNDPKKWEETISNFETQDEVNPPGKGLVLFTGSSSIAMWKDVAEYFPEYDVLNRGFGGSEFSDLLYYTDRIVYPYAPSKIFIYEGDNDLAAGESQESILKEAKSLREEIKAHLPNTPVIFIAAKPSVSRWHLKEKYESLNAALAEYAAENELTEFADIWTPMMKANGEVDETLFLEDELHMNAKGYAIWKKVLLPYLQD